LAKVDIGIYMAFCSALAEFETASMQLTKPASYTHVNLNGGEKKSPWVMIRKDCRDQIRSLGAQLGLSACSRARVKTKPKENKEGAKRFLA
jgi:P27 family predicted phage terminase small subunit